MEFEGTLVKELPLESGVSNSTGKEWRKKTWVFETQSGSFTNNIAVTAFGDRIDNLRFEMGKRYIVSIDVNSREYNGRWYTDIRAYSYRPADEVPAGGNFTQQAPGQAAAAAPAQGPAFGTAAPAASTDPFASDSNTDDLPF